MRLEIAVINRFPDTDASKYISVMIDHATRQTPLSLEQETLRETPPIPETVRAARSPTARVRASERTSRRGTRAPRLILCTARRAPGRERRTGPDGTARPARREGCSGKAREEGKLQRGPPTAADH